MDKPKKRDLSYLSKSLFLRGLQCPKSLYLYKTQPDLRDPVSQAQEAVFRAGTDVGVVAQGLFPGGKAIPYDAGRTPSGWSGFMKSLRKWHNSPAN